MMAKKMKNQKKGSGVVKEEKKAVRNRASLLPQNFPIGKLGSLPKHDFLRDEIPHKDAFAVALDTCYEGFAVDELDESIESKEREVRIRGSLQKMEEAGMFRYDITQPFGLGSKCAKTYVSRCLLGEEGSTYKYLGLRMFSYPWNGKWCKGDLKSSISSIHDLNLYLEKRTERHLQNLIQKRLRRGVEKDVASCIGRNKFDIALINRMDSAEINLKEEPTFGKERCTVSWHADSSLENYSTIAVHHTVFHVERSGSKEAIKSIERKKMSSWSVALRVSHNVEGPKASSIKSDQVGVSTRDPPIATTLPSGSIYYLLDDFNHHHQHAVLTSPSPKTNTVRFSSTHRLLREGHNIHFILQRCKTSCSSFHRKGPKLWRSEQLLLTEIETEWLRQFFIQGEGHKKRLWEWWEKPLRHLFEFWEKLENRTKSVCNLLEAASRGKCSEDMANKKRKKTIAKEKKAVTIIDDILSRKENNGSARSEIFYPIAELLEDRAMMREKWLQRERDSVFGRVPVDYTPIPFPVAFIDGSNNSNFIAESPMEGSPINLKRIAKNLRIFGECFENRNVANLPKEPSFKQNAKELPHKMGRSWVGWQNKTFGLELQSPWARLLLDGKKTIETRSYDIPSEKLLGRKIDVLESMAGTCGKSSIGNIVESLQEVSSVVKRIGWFKVSHVIKYESKVQFEDDERKHLVPKKSAYAWKEGTTIYGWVVSTCGYYNDKNRDSQQISRLFRRYRSIFEIGVEEVKKPSQKRKAKESNRKKKKRRF